MHWTRHTSPWSIAIAVVAVASLATIAPAAPPDKSAFSLVNPTPPELMRELSTDRPDTTESPYTVDAGHVQLEMSFLEYVHDGDRDEFSIAPVNLKLGLLNTVDLQVVFEPYLIQQNGDDAEGVGPTQLRVKWNLWGNDSGSSALAIMPFVKLPTEDRDVGNREVEAGMIVPLALDLPEGWSLGLMAEFDAVYDEADDGYDLEFVHTAAASHDLADRLGGYVEYIGVMSSDGETGYRALLGVGLTYALRADVQLDGGINVGLNEDADDVNPFIGVSVRF